MASRSVINSVPRMFSVKRRAKAGGFSSFRHEDGKGTQPQRVVGAGSEATRQITRELYFLRI